MASPYRQCPQDVNSLIICSLTCSLFIEHLLCPGDCARELDISVGQTDTTRSPPGVDVLIEGSPYEGLVSLGQRQEEAGEDFHGLASPYPRTTRRCPLARTASPVDRTGV